MKQFNKTILSVALAAGVFFSSCSSNIFTGKRFNLDLVKADKKEVKEEKISRAEAKANVIDSKDAVFASTEAEMILAPQTTKQLLAQAAQEEKEAIAQFKSMSSEQVKASKKEIKAELKKVAKAAKKDAKKEAASDKPSQIIALILCLFVGSLGIHRFYLGYTWQGVVQLLTAGACGIWTLIDLIRIVTGDLKPKNGGYGQKL
ncbi:MAG: TM2 domain-containing protein [Bacteroidetes bacterium]|nr:TM2 domain-containing protein [Bacteroidota bacterium]